MKKTGVVVGTLFGLFVTLNLSAGMLGDIGKDVAKGAENKAINKATGGVQVEWKGSWYPAHILKTKGDQFYIHYDGYSDSWNEWVGPSRIRK